MTEAKIVRLYSVYEMRNGKWLRLSHVALPFVKAQRYFQGALLNSNRALRSCDSLFTHRLVIK